MDTGSGATFSDSIGDACTLAGFFFLRRLALDLLLRPEAGALPLRPDAVVSETTEPAARPDESPPRDGPPMPPVSVG